MSKPIGGEHPATTLLTKLHCSSVAFHLHLADYSVHTNGYGKKIHGVVSGVYTDYDSDWAGRAGKLWWQGVVIGRGIDGSGNLNPQFMGIEELRKNYG
jgi:hypothetical protein